MSAFRFSSRPASSSLMAWAAMCLIRTAASSRMEPYAPNYTPPIIFPWQAQTNVQPEAMPWPSGRDTGPARHRHHVEPCRAPGAPAGASYGPHGEPVEPVPDGCRTAGAPPIAAAPSGPGGGRPRPEPPEPPAPNPQAEQANPPMTPSPQKLGAPLPDHERSV